MKTKPSLHFGPDWSVWYRVGDPYAIGYVGRKILFPSGDIIGFSYTLLFCVLLPAARHHTQRGFHTDI